MLAINVNKLENAMRDTFLPAQVRMMAFSLVLCRPYMRSRRCCRQF
jgi:hypothetical protein